MLFYQPNPQGHLAKKADFRPWQPVRIESDKVESRFSTILKLADALTVDPSEPTK